MWYVRANLAMPVVVSTMVAVLLHVNTLGNDLVWDDRAAVCTLYFTVSLH